jgi:hypothetical protein
MTDILVSLPSNISQDRGNYNKYKIYISEVWCCSKSCTLPRQQQRMNQCLFPTTPTGFPPGITWSGINAATS